MHAPATVSIPLPRILLRAFFHYAVFVTVVALLFGGGARQGLWSDAIAEILSLPLLGWAALRLSMRRLDSAGRSAVILVFLIVALPLLQLIPLPPSVWAALPGRGAIASGFDAAGIALPWLPLSLDPPATSRSLFSLIPGVAVFLAMLSLDGSQRRVLLRCMLIIAAIGVCIGFLQIMGVMGFYFYRVTNEGMAVGFFANGNHNATFLAVALSFAAARLIERYADSGHDRISVWMAGALVAVLAVGVAIVGSRAGLGLAFVSGFFCLAMAYRASAHLGKRVVMAGAAVFAAGALLVVLFGAAGWDKRRVQERDILDDLRWPVAAVTLQAVKNNLPFGTGFGTFIPVYDMNAPRTHLFERYVNHAHNDWLEVALDGGIPAFAAVLAFLGWFAAYGSRAWRSASAGLDSNLARAGSVAITLMLLHSIVDYPLRSIAMMTVLALSCGFLIPPRGADHSVRSPRRV